jgi:hypothetical protein
MSRPRFLDCIMTPNIISRIRERQEAYDKDPEGWEKREREREEERRQEEEYERHLYEKSQEQER